MSEPRQEASIRVAAASRPGGRDTRRRSSTRRGRLFVQQGFTATSMASIAAEAGVALKTVYVAFETKGGVLRSLWNLRLRGDGEDRRGPGQGRGTRGAGRARPRGRLLLNARNSREVKERVDGLFAVIRDAAPTTRTSASSGVASSATSTRTRRRSSRARRRRAPCAPGLDVDRATDVLWTINHPDVWLLLVRRARLDARVVRAVARGDHLHRAPPPRSVGAARVVRALRGAAHPSMLAPMPAGRPIVFLSDFGLGNEWVGLCHSVMSGIAPHCPIVDLSHLVRPLEVASGAILLADSMPYVHENAVVLAVVDPNVGRDREVAIETVSGRHLVGPDNGLLSSRGGPPAAFARSSSSRRPRSSASRTPSPSARRTPCARPRPRSRPACRSTSSGRASTPRRSRSW